MAMQTTLEAVQAGITISTVFLAPFYLYDVARAVHLRTNLFRRAHPIMNTRHMKNPKRYLAQFDICPCGTKGYKKRVVGAASRTAAKTPYSAHVGGAV